MPAIQNLALFRLAGPVGVPSPRSTTTSARTRAATASARPLRRPSLTPPRSPAKNRSAFRPKLSCRPEHLTASSCRPSDQIETSTPVVHPRQLVPPPRVVAKAEWTQGAANPRFVVTSLKPEAAGTRFLLRKALLRQGRHGEPHQGHARVIFADRTSAATMRANQLRLWFASMAYVLMAALRRIGLKHTQFAKATSHHPPEAPQDRRARATWCAASSSPWPPAAPTSATTPSPTKASPRRPADEPNSAQSS